LVGWQEGHPACKKMGDGGGGYWLVRMEWCPAGLLVCLPLLIFPRTIKSKSSLLAPAQPGGPGKNGRKTVVVWCGGGYENIDQEVFFDMSQSSLHGHSLKLNKKG